MTVPSDRWTIMQQQQVSDIPPPRVVLYGEPGIGKTTFAASAPGCVLIPCESGALGVSVPRLPSAGKCETWDDVLHAVDVLAKQSHEFRWVALDTFNAAESLCVKMVVERDFGGAYNSRKGVEGFQAWGRGDKAVANEFRQLLDGLDYLQQQRGMGVILLGHVGVTRSANALGADFQKFVPEVSKHTWALTCQWADQIGYACRNVRAAQREGEKAAKAQAIGSERWIIWEGGPAIDAKSRAGYDMPEKTLLSWPEYSKAAAADRTNSLVEQAQELIAEAAPEVASMVLFKLGGDVGAVAKLDKNKLEALINWLLAKQSDKKES